MWQEANSWRNPDLLAAATPTIFDHAAQRIRQEVSERRSLDATEIVTLATVQELDHAHRATLVEGSGKQPNPAPTVQEAPRRFDDPRRREQLRMQLDAAGVPEPAIEARTLADLGQAREAELAVQTPITTGAEPKPPAARRDGRQLRRQR